MTNMLEATMRARVNRGAAFLDMHYPNWWKHIDLGTLSISSCHRCVLGQVYPTIPDEEKAQLLAQATEYWRTWYSEPGLAEEAAEMDTDFGKIAHAHEELHYHGAEEFGFAWTPGSEHLQEPLLTEAWTRLIISRRLANHVDVDTENSDLDRAKVLVAA